MSLFSPFIVQILTIYLTYSEAAHCSQQNKNATGISSDDAFVRLYFLSPNLTVLTVYSSLTGHLITSEPPEKVLAVNAKLVNFLDLVINNQ